MNPDRRTLLKTVAAAPLVFGLRELFAQDAPAGRPEWFDAALQRMSGLGRFGVVLVVPDPLELKPAPAAPAPHEHEHSPLGPRKVILRQAVFLKGPARLSGTLRD